VGLLLLAEYAPPLIVLDGSVSATCVDDANDVEGVKQLYGSIREATAGTGTVTVLLHHERKPSQDHGRGSAADAATGTRYWHNLADIGYALQQPSPTEVSDTDTGRRLTTIVKLEATKAIRSTETLRSQHVRITGDLGPHGELVRTEFALSCDPKALELREAIIEAGHPLSASALAEARNMDPRGGAFDDARRSALDSGVIVQPGGPRTPYHVGDPDDEPTI
jgi:hypothetical protein